MATGSLAVVLFSWVALDRSNNPVRVIAHR